MTCHSDDALTFLEWFTFMQYIFNNAMSRRLLGDSTLRFARRTLSIVLLVIGFCLADGLLLSVLGQNVGEVGTGRELESERLWAQEEAPLYVEHCLTCHEGETAEAGLDLSALGRDLSDPENLRRWVLVHDRIQSGEMPPEAEPRIDTALKREFLDSLSNDLNLAQRQRNDVVLRRLNRVEYENSVRDVSSASQSWSRICCHKMHRRMALIMWVKD